MSFCQPTIETTAAAAMATGATIRSMRRSPVRAVPERSSSSLSRREDNTHPVNTARANLPRGSSS